MRGPSGLYSGRPFTLLTHLAEDLGSSLRFGRPPGLLDPGDGSPPDRLVRRDGPSRSVLWTADNLRFGLARPITSSYNSACNQAGAFGPIFWSPIYPFKVKDDDAGEDTTGSKTTGRYNSWRLELYITGGGTALEKPGNLFPGFIEGDNVGKVATGRLSMILDIVRSVTRTLAMRLATRLGVTPGETHSSELGSCLA